MAGVRGDPPRAQTERHASRCHAVAAACQRLRKACSSNGSNDSRFVGARTPAHHALFGEPWVLTDMLEMAGFTDIRVTQLLRRRSRRMTCTNGPR